MVDKAATDAYPDEARTVKNPTGPPNRKEAVEALRAEHESLDSSTSARREDRQAQVNEQLKRFDEKPLASKHKSSTNVEKA